jgi:hypothetical protein
VKNNRNLRIFSNLVTGDFGDATFPKPEGATQANLIANAAPDYGDPT